ncbi:MAG: nucleotide exchange factor GrpE [Burkholderiales bacterium]|nr:nucleotide exchange factor GrpE [Burkholderiales bacterium]
MPEQQDTFEPASAATPADTPPENTADAALSVEDRLQQAERKAAEHHDAWLRAKADAENIRRRAQEDVTKAHKFAVEGFSQELLAVRDSLEAALGVTSATVESMHSGVELTLRQLTTAFEKFAVKEVNPIGEKFDPHRHQAMTMVESDQPANTVVQVFQKGYLLHDRVLRPALVSVAKAPDA